MILDSGLLFGATLAPCNSTHKKAYSSGRCNLSKRLLQLFSKLSWVLGISVWGQYAKTNEKFLINFEGGVGNFLPHVSINFGLRTLIFLPLEL